MKTMNLLKNLIVVFLITFLGACNSNSARKESQEIDISFKEEDHNFTEFEKELVIDILTESEKEIRALLPKLPVGIKVIVEIVDWDIDVVGGVTGRAESNTPPVIMIQVSNTFPGGVVSAIHAGLRSTVYHEFHHLSLGWAIQDNKYIPEIPIATVIEGLAEVFAEEYTKVIYLENQIPENVIVDDWITEILALPAGADYQTWMFQHPDGRTSIGYRTGNYLIKQAMSNSGKTILELSSIPPDELIELAGYSY
jgi:hypothetical protein